jgi:hypothetical protein
MYLECDLTSDPPTTTLRDPEDCDRLKVVVKGPGAKGPEDAARLAAALTGIGRPQGTQVVFLEPDALRRMAAGRVAPDWDQSFQRMLDYARTKGWTDEATGTVRAHCEWP